MDINQLATPLESAAAQELETGYVNSQRLLYGFEQTMRAAGLSDAIPDRARLLELLAGTHDEKMVTIGGAIKRLPSCLIDTIRVKIKLRHEPLIEHRSLKQARYGYQVASRFKTKATIYSAELGDALIIEVSPSMYLTGQNVVGLMDMRIVAPQAIQAVLKDAGIRPTERERRKIEQGKVEVLRADCVVHCNCGSYYAARVLLLALRDYMAGVSSEFTVYGYGESLYDRIESRDHTLKIYGKGDQLRKKPMPDRVHRKDTLIAAAEAMVRFEVCLRTPMLKRRGLEFVKNWEAGTPQSLLEEQISKLTPLHAVSVHLAGMESLTELTAARLRLWMLGDKTAFNQNADVVRKQRKAIRDATGIEINSPLSVQRQAEAVIVAQSLMRRGIVYGDITEYWDKLVRARLAL